jgi:hypothetical protein
VGKKTALLFFSRVGIARLAKNKCAVCALAFLVQMFNFSTIFALCTTSLYMARSVQKGCFHSVKHKPDF